MVRNTAREIAVHLSYELSFTDKPVEELLDRAPDARSPSPPWRSEDPLYQETPNAKQADYIRRLVRGVAEHAAGAGRVYRQIRQGVEFCPDPPGGLRHHAGGHV